MGHIDLLFLDQGLGLAPRGVTTRVLLWAGRRLALYAGWEALALALAPVYKSVDEPET